MTYMHPIVRAALLGITVVTTACSSKASGDWQVHPQYDIQTGANESRATLLGTSPDGRDSAHIEAYCGASGLGVEIVLSLNGMKRGFDSLLARFDDGPLHRFGVMAFLEDSDFTPYFEAGIQRAGRLVIAAHAGQRDSVQLQGRDSSYWYYWTSFRQYVFSLSGGGAALAALRPCAPKHYSDGAQPDRASKLDKSGLGVGQ